jgi:hypothetical protein
MIACTVCPTCRRETNTDHISYHAKTINGTLNEITTWRCSECDIFFVERVEKISTVYLLSPVTTALSSPEIPTEEEVQQHIKENTYTCSKCGKEFVADADVEPCELENKVVCDDCYNVAYQEDRGGTQPDDDQFLCSDCGTLHDIKNVHFRPPDAKKVCASCIKDYQSQEEIECDAELHEDDEENEPEYIQLPGSRTVSYCIDGDIIKLQYKGNDCNSYTFDVVWDIVDSPKPDWMSRIDEMLEGEKNHIQKASALNQLCKAVSKGTVKIPGSDE